jgi:hypothetical protein
MAITAMLIVTMPIWFIPYTAFAIYKLIKGKKNG